MKTPNLNRRICIQQQSSTQDASGQPIQTWSTVYSCWANKDIIRGQLIYNTAEFVSKATQLITIRYTQSAIFEANMRIVYVEQPINVVHTYEIQAILNPEDANVWIQFLCYELNGAQ